MDAALAEPAASQRVEVTDSFDNQLGIGGSQQADPNSLQHASKDEQQPAVSSQLNNAEGVLPSNTNQDQIAADTPAPEDVESADKTSPEQASREQQQETLAVPDQAASAASFSGTASTAGSENSADIAASQSALASSSGTEIATESRHIQAEDHQISSIPISAGSAVPLSDTGPTAGQQVAGIADTESHEGQAGSSEDAAATQQPENGHTEPSSSQPGESDANQHSAILSQHDTEAAEHEHKPDPSDVTNSTQDTDKQEPAQAVQVPEQSSGVQGLLPGQTFSSAPCCRAAACCAALYIL